MKKNLFLCIPFLLIFIKGFSQKDLAFEIKGGINFSEMVSEDFQENEGHTGYHLGASVSFPLTNKFSLETGVGYSQQGGKAELSTYEDRAKMELDYIQLPVTLKIALFPKLSLSTGTSLNILVNEELSFEYNAPFLYSFLPIGPREIESKNLEVNASLGLHYELFSRFFLYTTYIHGLNDAVKFGNDSVEARNRAYQFGIGYQF